MQVPLCHIMFGWVDPVVIASKEYSFALTAVFGFNYKRFCFAFVKLLSKRFVISGQDPRLWKELIVIRKVLLDCQ
jgi:hypothetical protein